MPTLDWLNRAEALTAADKVPYRVLEPVSEHGDGKTALRRIILDGLPIVSRLHRNDGTYAVNYENLNKQGAILL